MLMTSKLIAMSTLLYALMLPLGGCAPAGERPADAPPQFDKPAGAEATPCLIPPKGERRVCTQQYDPVCGCNGETYGNACMATAAGVTRSRPGRCEDPPSAVPDQEMNP